MTREQAIKKLTELLPEEFLMEYSDAIRMAIKALEQQPCEDVCEWFVQSIDFVTDIVEFIFSDGTVKRVKRGLYMRDIEESLRKMLIDQMANEKKQEPCDDCISRQAAIVALDDRMSSLENVDMQVAMGFAKGIIHELPPVAPQQKMGHWEWNQYDANPKIGNFHCSLCHSIGRTYFDYCPYCGAKMLEIPTGAEGGDKE